MLMLIEKAIDWLFGDVKRILIVAVLLVIGMAAAVGMIYKHERDAARAELAKVQTALAKAEGDNQALGASLARQSQAVTDMQKAAIAREAAAAAAAKPIRPSTALPPAASWHNSLASMPARRCTPCA